MYAARIESEWEQTARIAYVTHAAMGGKMKEADFMPNITREQQKTSLVLSPAESLNMLEKAFS